MFSAEATARGSQRNPRRRQRNDSDGLQHPRRKRSKIAEGPYHSPGGAHAHVNGNGSAMANGLKNAHGDADASLVLVDMPVREKTAPAQRAAKVDAAQYLTKNDNYSVTRLPSFPASLSQPGTPFLAFALPSAGLALALTSGHALAWDYSGAAGPSRVLTLPLPFALKPSEPLPLGAIVRNGPTNEFGILAVAPSRGKIVFWENVDSAQVRSHFAQHPQGVEGSVKMFSGEVITGLVDIDHAGYILIISSGRIVQLTLRDSQGRPSIATNILNAPNGSSSSFFSFKGLLGNAFRKSIASVKARPSASKGQMEVITATKNGLFQIWDLSWSGQHMFRNEVDVHAEVLAAIQSGMAPESRGQQEAHVLDFTFLHQQKSEAATALLVLVALSSRGSIEYSLLEVDLSNNEGVISRAIPIRNFHQAQVPTEPTGVLLLPRPGHTAFIQFPGALVVASLAEPEESPDAQLLSDSGKPTFPFQDAIYLRGDRHLQFCGSAMETPLKKDQQASAVLFIHGYGLVRLSAMPPATDDDDIGRHRVTAKSKLEQAIFFSINPDNILDFSIRSRYTFALEEVETAALEISAGILSSSYDYLDKVTSSMDDQMQQRSLALHTLITQVLAEYADLSWPVRWKLLWNAEKIAAASALWKAYQGRIQDKHAHPEAYPESLLLPHMVKVTHEGFKTMIRPELGETDPVRQFFLKDIRSMHIIMVWAWQCLRTWYLNNNEKKRDAVMQRLDEANEAFLATLGTAYQFRTDNLEHYGMNPEDFEEGVLIPNRGQNRLPESWTATHNIVSSLRSLVDVSRNLAFESFEKHEHEERAMKIAQDNPPLVELSCKTHQERFSWGKAQEDEQKRAMGDALYQEWDNNARPEQIYGLASIGMANDGMILAEEYKDMTTLARLIWDETQYLENMKRQTQSKMEQAECVVKLNRIKKRIHRYFEEYGNAWASSFYTRYIKEQQSERLFYQEFLNQTALTRYLRSTPLLGRVAWINEVVGEKNYGRAHDQLRDMAEDRESNAWCKKVELSISKLSLLCKRQAPGKGEEAPAPTAKELVDLAKVEHRLEYVKIQDHVYDRIAPIIESAVDDAATIEMLMAEYGKGRLEHRPALQQLLKQGFDQLINHRVLEPALLIDVLTLMTYDDDSADPTELVQNNEFAFALQVLVLSWDGLQPENRENLLRLIWKRLCIKDNWAEINETANFADDEVAEMLSRTSLGHTLKQLEQMIAMDEYNKAAWPRGSRVEDLLGAGCTNGELCVRFSSEDLRNPIIADNLADDEVLQTNIEQHRLDHWYQATFKEAERALAADQQYLHGGMNGAVGGMNGAVVGMNGGAPSAANGGDGQGGHDQDVEMQD